MKRIFIFIVLVFCTSTLFSQTYSDSIVSPKSFDKAAMWSVQNLKNVNITDNKIYGYYTFIVRGDEVKFSVKIEKVERFCPFADNVYITLCNFNHIIKNYSTDLFSKTCPKNLTESEWNLIKEETDKKSVSFMTQLKNKIDFNPLNY
jgi:hypothetical protein